jgi:hypothetical protein
MRWEESTTSRNYLAQEKMRGPSQAVDVFGQHRSYLDVRVPLQKTRRICDELGHYDDAMYQGIGVRRSSEARTPLRL